MRKIAMFTFIFATFTIFYGVLFGPVAFAQTVPAAPSTIAVPAAPMAKGVAHSFGNFLGTLAKATVDVGSSLTDGVKHGFSATESERESILAKFPAVPTATTPTGLISTLPISVTSIKEIFASLSTFNQRPDSAPLAPVVDKSVYAPTKPRDYE